MTYDRSQIELAMCAMRVFVIIGGVAIVAFAAGGRTMFFAGAAGSLLGLVVPEPLIHAQCSNIEAAYMASLRHTADLRWAIPLALIVFLVPCFLMSWWVEFAVLHLVGPDPVGDDAHSLWKYAWKANLATYALLAILLLLRLANTS